LKIFRLQYEYNDVYKEYVNTLGVNPAAITTIEDIPFLPVQLFKTHAITTTQFIPAVIFESSGTTGNNISRHYIKDLSVYKRSFTGAFNLFYGDPGKWCIMALLPGYVERQNSSLVKMADELINETNHPLSGFYLHDQQELYEALLYNENRKQLTLLIGVTFALLDFAEKYKMKLRYTTVMETGGMKGRREEITRDEFHKVLQDNLGTENIHSEYGMTELLSQAYAKERGLFRCPPWMKILVREENDPFLVSSTSGSDMGKTGLLNIIDLANLYSCPFVATDDVGKLYKNGNFLVLGRRDISDVRGCNLLLPSDN
jgi:phenylacetate-coenzyme A ligase PaaK-like adenylate-forming protein